MRKLEVTDTTVLKSALRGEARSTPEFRYLHRLHCMQLVAQGCSCYQVAKWFGEHPSTMERWVSCFCEYGLVGLWDEQKTGRPRKVRDDQMSQLQGDILRTPSELGLGYGRYVWSGKLLKTYLARHYVIELSVRQCQRLLKQLLLNVVSHDTGGVPRSKKDAAHFCRQQGQLHPATSDHLP
ncbi:MAG: helix-turn-helix domain-containing protein [Gammaproteobacteria bacterium]|nr:helix-turn-helix domain-containing protein [Gammaproteobacteria bacterium]